MPRLTDIDVEEVSLVDRPANGRRFRLFKRAGFPRLRERVVPEDAATGATATAPAGETITSGDETESAREPGTERILKRLEEALETVSAQALELERRLERLETSPARQSLDRAGSTETSLWKGVFR